MLNVVMFSYKITFRCEVNSNASIKIVSIQDIERRQSQGFPQTIEKNFCLNTLCFI